MIPYLHALFIQRHGMISALMKYGRSERQSLCNSSDLCKVYGYNSDGVDTD